MNYKQLSTEEKRDIYDAAISEFELGNFSEELFRKTLIELGYNATDIEDIVREHRPPAPENCNGTGGE